MALVGHVDQISRTRVEGWVIDTCHPDKSVSLSIFVNGEHRGCCVTTHARSDVVLPTGEPVTEKCAFYFAFVPPLSTFVSLRVDVMETWSAQVLVNGSRTLPRPGLSGGPTSARIPILLTSTGRSGTTLLMSEFARHRDIVVGDHYPYEIKQIAYHAAAFRALAADSDWERSTSPETMLTAEMNHIVGSNPYNMTGLFDLGGGIGALRDFYQTTVPSGFATLFRNFILEFYATLANAQGKPAAPFFCEKGDVDDAVTQGARLFFDAVKDIVIVRDPRDLLCSAIAFWKLRPEAAMTMLMTTVPRLARIARHAGPDTIVIRYEDLVRAPSRSRRVLSHFLDRELHNPLTIKGHEIPESHRTSSDPAASIGRWRNELTPEQVDACEVAFGLYMREFGYEAAERARSAAYSRGHESELIVAAEGALAVTAFVENTVVETADGTPARRLLELTFGRDGNGEAFTGEGWSIQERRFIWSSAYESRLRLPAIREPGDYRLYITAAPFTHGTELTSQRVMVFIDKHKAGFARVGDLCVLSIIIPAAAAGSGQTIELVFRFPDAARPSDVLGSVDDRRLGFSLYRVALFRIEPTQSAVLQPGVDQPAADQQGRDQPVVDPPAVDQAVPGQPVVDRPAADRSVADQPLVDQPLKGPPAVDQAVMDHPVEDQSVADQVVADQPMEGPPTVGQPAADRSVADQPVVDQPAEGPPAAHQPVLDWASATSVHGSRAPDTDDRQPGASEAAARERTNFAGNKVA